MQTLHGPQPFNLALLGDSLQRFLGEVDASLFEELSHHLEWLELAGGDVLMSEGEPGDSLYFVISGRLRAHVRLGDGTSHQIGEIVRGETVGEMALFTGEPRSATVAAIRDSVLVRLSRDVFENIIQRHPLVAISVTKLIIERLKRASNPRLAIKRPINLCLLAITDGIDTLRFGQQVAAELARRAPTLLLDSASIDAALGAGLAQTDKDRPDAYRRLSLWLDETEARHDFVIFVADPTDSAWTTRCIRQSDEILLLADAAAPAQLHPLEQRYFALDAVPTATATAASANTAAADSGAGSGAAWVGATQRLVLLHPADQRMPRGTAAWLDRRPVASHLHVRAALASDMARLGRILAGQANGLVFAGGGAKGFAHLGVYKALEEFDIPVDYVGGASIGAVMAAYVGFDLPAERMIELARAAFRENPTGDLNIVPLVSLIGGRKLKSVIDGAVEQAVGFSCGIEDTWRNFFCVLSSYSRAEEVIARRGPLDKCIRASVSIPAALPPVVIQRELMVDGGVFNNFPVDEMLRMQAARVIGVDLAREDTRRYDFEEMPGTLALLGDRRRPRKARRYRLPGLLSVMFQATVLASTQRQRAAADLADLCFRLDTGRVGMLEWKRFDEIVQIGYQQARAVLSAMSPGELERYR